MKKSQLRKLVLEAMAGGYEPDGKGNLKPHYDRFDSTKLSDLLMGMLEDEPQDRDRKYQGDPDEGERILTQKSDPENVARITRGEEPIYEGEGEQTYNVTFYVGDDDYDWDVKASSPEEAIKKVKSGEAEGPYGQTLPRTARKFNAVVKK